MTIHQPGQPHEFLTNEQLKERLHLTGAVHNARFTEPVTLHLQPIPHPTIKLCDCDFAYGLQLRNDRVLRDTSFEGSRFAGECRFDFFTTKIVSLVETDASEATFWFERVRFPLQSSDDHDLWWSQKPGSTAPKLVTDDKVIWEMFRQLPETTECISYQQVKSELA